ncbi:hypothetical protein, partial [Aedoeadaptatus coxii]|uniref:hypothetical protein n=1 Tax=Aedoeadaptatus coxii TaxID=755172 RepID=UPI001E59EBDC
KLVLISVTYPPHFPFPADPIPILAGFLIRRKCLRHFPHLMPCKQKETHYIYSIVIKKIPETECAFSRRNPIQIEAR